MPLPAPQSQKPTAEIKIMTVSVSIIFEYWFHCARQQTWRQSEPLVKEASVPQRSAMGSDRLMGFQVKFCRSYGGKRSEVGSAVSFTSSYSNSWEEKKKFKVRCIQTYPKDLRWTEIVLTRLKTTALLYIKLLSGSTFRLPLVLRATNSGQFTWDTKHTQGQNIMNSHVTVTHISTLGCQECYKQQKLLKLFIYFNF